MSASIPLHALKSLLQDAFPTAEEARVWLRERCDAVDEEGGPLTDEALAPLLAMPGDLVLTQLLDAAPFLMDRVRILAASSGLTLPSSAFDEAEFAVRRGVGALVHLLAGGDYALAYRFFHRSFAWGGRAADVEPGNALASLDRLTDNLLQLGAYKQEEMFKVLLAEHPGHAEEIHQLARWMGHFTLAPAPSAPPAPAPPSFAERLLSALHQARLKIVAWRRPSRLALVLMPCMAILVVFLTASTPPEVVQEHAELTRLKAQNGELRATNEEQARLIVQRDEEIGRLKEALDEADQENITLRQKDTLAQEALTKAEAMRLQREKAYESLCRKNRALGEANEKPSALATADEEPAEAVSAEPPPAAPPSPPPLRCEPSSDEPLPPR